jgi:hypothetical protein
MKRKLVCYLLVALCTFGLGCHYGSISDTATTIVNASNTVNEDDVNSYRYANNARFVITSREQVKLGAGDTKTFYTIVDLKTGCMYLQSSEYNYGLTTDLVQLTNADGSPMVVHDIDAMRDYYGYRCMY